MGNSRLKSLFLFRQTKFTRSYSKSRRTKSLQFPNSSFYAFAFLHIFLPHICFFLFIRGFFKISNNQLIYKRKKNSSAFRMSSDSIGLFLSNKPSLPFVLCSVRPSARVKSKHTIHSTRRTPACDLFFVRCSF